MASLKSVFGRIAESEAEAWWKRYRPESRLLERNFRCRMGEVDLIFEERRPDRGWELVFVEVRSRARDAWVDAAASVSYPKRRRLELAARQFLAQYRGDARSVRMDVLARDGSTWTHLVNAWS